MATLPNFTEYVVKLGNCEDKEFNIMRFKPPHKCDLEKLNNPKLERQETKVNDGINEQVDDSEYRHKEREEARRRRRGLKPRKSIPSDQPWVLKESKKDGKHFIGRKEGAFNTSASYYVMSLGSNNSFEAYPISNWYDFVPPVKYNFLNDEEAEERFEKRNKTLNYFSIMVNKRIKEKEDNDDQTTTPTNTKDSDDSDGEFSSVDSDRERPSKKKSKKTKSKKSSKVKDDDSEAGEETDVGDVESQEMDYFPSSSSDSEEERKQKEIKEQPRDDAEVERKEKGGVDEVFVERSSSSEDELTESGKQLKALIHRKSHVSDSEQDDENKETTEQQSNENTQQNNSKGIKRELSPEGTAGDTETVSSKKPKLEPSTPNTITQDEVIKYLSRKPLTSKALMKKFIKLKPEMNKDSITAALAKIVKSLPQLHTEEINRKKYLSIRATV